MGTFGYFPPQGIGVLQRLVASGTTVCAPNVVTTVTTVSISPTEVLGMYLFVTDNVNGATFAADQTALFVVLLAVLPAGDTISAFYERTVNQNECRIRIGNGNLAAARTVRWAATAFSI